MIGGPSGVIGLSPVQNSSSLFMSAARGNRSLNECRIVLRDFSLKSRLWPVSWAVPATLTLSPNLVMATLYVSSRRVDCGASSSLTIGRVTEYPLTG